MADMTSAPYYSLDAQRSGTFRQDKPLRLHLTGDIPREHIQDSGFALDFFCLSEHGPIYFTQRATAEVDPSGGAFATVPLADMPMGQYQLISLSTWISEGGGNAVVLFLGANNGQPLASFMLEGEDRELNPQVVKGDQPVSVLWSLS